jgi:hypothetical protein
MGGCSHSAGTSQASLASELQAEVEREVERTIRAFFRGFSVATCTDGSAVSQFARNPSIYVDDTEVFTVSLSDYESGVRARACKWRSHGGGVDSIVVDALSDNVAMAAWTYHDDIMLNTGQRRQTKGAVLMTLVRSASGWKITSSKTTEINDD